MKRPEKVWWNIQVSDGEYSHTYEVFARSVKEKTDDRFERGRGLVADGVLLDFMYETITELRRLP